MYSSWKLDGANGSSASGSMKGANFCMKAKSDSELPTSAGESGTGDSLEKEGESFTSNSMPVPELSS